MSDLVINPRCELCGEPMPPGETMFKFHGYSGPCPKPSLSQSLNEISNINERLEQVDKDCLEKLKIENLELKKILVEAMEALEDCPDNNALTSESYQKSVAIKIRSIIDKGK